MYFFRNFLRYEEFYDQILAVNVACQAAHWNIVSLLAKSRGLQQEVVSAFGQILQSARAPKATDRDFTFALSDSCLTQSFLIFPNSSREIFHFIRINIDNFPIEILRRFVVQLDPSQPSIASLVNRIFTTTKEASSLETTIESIDFENSDRLIVTVKDLIETFLFVLITLISKTKTEYILLFFFIVKTNSLIFSYHIKFLNKQELPEGPFEEYIAKIPDLKPLSCGYEHAAIVRNTNLYTMGVSSSGCLGLGPLLTQSSPPKLVQTLTDLRVKVLSVSCGRKHTLALTDHGVINYSNMYKGVPKVNVIF